MTDSTWHVCSLIVQFKKEHAETVKTDILAIPEAEIVASNDEECKYVVLMESENSSLLYKQIESMQDIPGVLAVSLVYHQQDEQTEDHV